MLNSIFFLCVCMSQPICSVQYNWKLYIIHCVCHQELALLFTHWFPFTINIVYKFITAGFHLFAAEMKREKKSANKPMRLRCCKNGCTLTKLHYIHSYISCSSTSLTTQACSEYGWCNIIKCQCMEWTRTYIKLKYNEPKCVQAYAPTTKDYQLMNK